MATLKICIRKNLKRKSGLYPVYISVNHHTKVGYIRTEKVVNDNGLNKNGEVKDPYVVSELSKKIVEYYDRLNRKDINSWTTRDIIDFLLSEDEDLCFSDYARKHIDRMIDRGQERNSKNYMLAVQHLERFAGTNKVMFSHLTSAFVNRWIKSLEQTKRAKEMYPICIRQVYRAAVMEFNDYDTGIIRIKTNPWVKVQIPKADRPEKLAISAEECRTFFAAPLPDSKMKEPLAELGRDVAMMILCLGGINTVDLYNLKRADYHGGIIHYQRAKTRNSRADGAYMEMRVPPILEPVVEKYLNRDEHTDWLFNFHVRHTSSDSFGANVNTGIRQVCESMHIPREQWYCGYTFRHTWGTVAQNDVHATIDEVAFGMNHSSGHKVTRGYIKIDFTPAWELNEKVVDFIFFSDKPSTRNEHADDEEQHFRLSYRYMVDAAAYYQGRKVATLTDVGFNNVDEVIARLVAMLPDDIPMRAMVMFKIVNMDKDQTVVYQRQKGKGFE